MTQVDFEEIRQKGTPAAKGVIDRVTEAGLEYFLGGPHVLYREAVEEFFKTATLSGDKITATVSGTEFELTEESVTESLRLPTDGQDAASDLELTTFEAACQILSATKEPLKVSGNKATLRPEKVNKIQTLPREEAAGPRLHRWPKEDIHQEISPGKRKDRKQGQGEDSILEPPSQTRDEEESASTSERTDSEKTDDERPNDEEHSGTSPDNTGTGANPENAEASEEGSEEEEEEDDQKKADFIARRILKDVELRAEAVGELYREWHENRFDRLYKHMLPGLIDEECFRRLKEIEETVMSLTNAETIHEALGRTSIIRPRARLQKLTVRIRKLKERYVEGTPEANLQLLVLEKLETVRGELAEEIDRLEAVVGQRGKQHSLASETDHGATPPRADPVINETDERTETPLVGKLETEQHGVSEPGVTKENLNASLEDRNNKLQDDLKALTSQVDELIKAKMNADIAVVEANARAAKEVQDALDEEARREKEPPQLTEEERAERERRTVAKYPGLAKSVAAQAAADAERLNNERQRLEDFATAHKKKKTTAPSYSVPAKQKRKPSKKAQVAGLLDGITDTVIESQPDQATRTEDEDEEHLVERSTRQRVSESASQPQPFKRKRTKDMMASFNFSDSE
ncbi:uncharacterized abhydrolase domain-containing protein DDB_G0269086-like [Impatiens glandulifera]|uniref:uncharacterized abhydrolase domain-containing protein DDB_G0269086-like n=1 Tax=Impatiens glandulifera TaxID=253017 RepID=UPI001FB0F8C6|nr:uncharacterized abhydrolase domain-containing protein DDB_G0269086-like [Impatiens glandulifera]